VAPDRRSRPARWDYIGQVKQAVAIPVFGNGDIFDRHDCLRMINETGCDGVALGRMAIARPWIFAEFMGQLQTNRDRFSQAAIQLIELLKFHYDPIGAIQRFKRFAFYFCANFRFGHALYTQIINAADMQRIESIIRGFFEQSPDIQDRPNMNFFR
jgi:tRNA-dihydrouridine synthase